MSADTGNSSASSAAAARASSALAGSVRSGIAPSVTALLRVSAHSSGRSRAVQGRRDSMPARSLLSSAPMRRMRSLLSRSASAVCSVCRKRSSSRSFSPATSGLGLSSWPWPGHSGSARPGRSAALCCRTRGHQLAVLAVKQGGEGLVLQLRRLGHLHAAMAEQLAQQLLPVGADSHQPKLFHFYNGHLSFSQSFPPRERPPDRAGLPPWREARLFVFQVVGQLGRLGHGLLIRFAAEL